MAVSFSSIPEHPILHGCELFNHLWNNLACMAVSFSIISGTFYLAWLCTLKTSLDNLSCMTVISGQPILHGCGLCNHLCHKLSCMAVSCYILSCMAVRFQPSLEQTILHGCQLFKHPSLGHPILHDCELFNHLCNNLSCMAVSFSNISGASYPAWL